MRIAACRSCRRRRSVERLHGFCPSCHHRLHGRKTSVEPLAVGVADKTSIVPVRPQKSAVNRLPAQIGHRLEERSQMLEVFLNTYYPAASSRLHGSTWILSLPKIDLTSPLLGNAVDTISLAHLASKESNTKFLNLARETFDKGLNMIIRGLANPHRPTTAESRRNFVMSALLLGLCQDYVVGKTQNQSQCSYTQHLWGLREYIAINGPSVLAVQSPLEHNLFQNMRMGCLFVSLSKRQAFTLGETFREWTPLPQNANTGNGLTTWFPIVQDLPGLLEKADQLLVMRQQAPQDLLNIYNELEMIKHNALHWLKHEAPLCEELLGTVQITDSDAFDMVIEEHCFITSFTNPPILSFHQFADAQHGMRHLVTWLVCLISNCTMLRILRTLGTPPPSPHVHGSHTSLDNETFHFADDLCKSLHYYGTVNSLGYGWFISVLLKVTHAFFEEVGAVQYANWCQCALIALKLRLRRLEADGYPSLCRVSSLGGPLTNSVRFRTMPPRHSSPDAAMALPTTCPFSPSTVEAFVGPGG